MRSVSQRLAAFFFYTAFALSAAAVHAQAFQTNVDQAKHMVDEHGVPQLTIDGIGKVNHPAWTALYALAYAGIEDYDPSLGLKADSQRFAASINWLKTNLKQDSHGLWVWPYNFDSTYNDVAIKAPWSSAFAQASGVQALIAHWKKTGDQSSLELAQKAAESLFVPLSEGGFLFVSGQDIWFEEIPSSATNPSHILNGHMRALLALGELKDATGDARYQEWFTKGSDTLLRWLPQYDAGYWLRYDLNPRKEELLFRLANPYGFANPELAIERIVLRDPLTGEESVLDVGGPSDAEGAVRIAGNDWGQIEQLEGRSVRRLRPVEGESEAVGSEGQMVAPYSYFYLKLPGLWQDNLRKEPYELSVEYLDEKPGNLEIQMRSISPESRTFKKLRDGDLLLSGQGEWRKWKVDLPQSQLGYWVGELYARKHAEYLVSLSKNESRFHPWADMAMTYLRSSQEGRDFEVVSPAKVELPRQTPMLPVYSLDENGVLMQHLAAPESEFDATGSYDGSTDQGAPEYSPYVVATQYISGASIKFPLHSSSVGREIHKAPALAWFKNKKFQVGLGEAITYVFPFSNTYNDVVTAADWPSAFSQAYILKALRHSWGEGDSESQELLKKVSGAYRVSVKQGGISSYSKEGDVFFEEVPNATHVLNAHLVSVPELYDTAESLGDSSTREIFDAGVRSLRSSLALFDTGYWMRYDLNPAKELLFQFDWLDGEVSPLVESVRLESPQFAKKVLLDVGGDQAFDGASRIAGLDWSSSQFVDGRLVRAFSNGYLSRKKSIKGGGRHNVYALMRLPEEGFLDYFEVRSHRLVIRFKDVAEGKFVIKIRSINEGGSLDFVPLRNSVIATKGDQKWKEVVIEVRPQDMGWYKGEDYQVFEVDQLNRISKITGDWFFDQYAQRQGYYLSAKKSKSSPIVQPSFKVPLDPLKVTVVESSQTYAGYEFINSLDGDPSDDYVAGVEGDSVFSVDLAVGRFFSSGLLRLRWENSKNYSRTISAYAINHLGEVLREVASFSVSTGADVDIPLSALNVGENLRLEFSDFQGQSRLLLRELEVLAAFEGGVVNIEPVDVVVSDKLEGGIDIFLDSRAPTNPLHPFRLPITANVKKISDDLSRGINSDHEKILKFMDYMSGYKVGITSDGMVDTVFSEKTGSCGTFTNALLSLAAAQGLEGRVIGLYNYPKNTGHVVAEIKVNGVWRVYDPTYDAFYTWAGSSDPLSYEDIRAGYLSGKDIVLHARSERFGIEGYTGRNIFMGSAPQGIVGPENPMIFPLTLDYKVKRELSKEDFGLDRQGASYIGSAHVNNNQVWDIKGLDVGGKYEFVVQPESLLGDVNDFPPYFDLIVKVKGSEFKHRFDFSNGKPESLSIPISYSPDGVKVELSHSYAGLQYRYMIMESYKVVDL